MMDSLVSPAYLLRSYVWELLKRNDPNTWNENKYGGLIPIVPLSEEPELSQYSGPRIVYGFATSSAGGPHFRKQGSMTLAVYDENFRRLTRTLNILETALGREDESAEDVNDYTSTLTGFVGLRFGYIGLSFSESGTPEDEEGGRQSALINIRYEYYVDLDVTTKLT